MKKLVLPLLILLLALGAAGARAEEARDITAQCTFTSPAAKSSDKPLYNKLYTHWFQSAKRKTPYIQIDLPKGETCSGIQIQWAFLNPNWEIQTYDGDKWVTCAEGNPDFYTTYTPLPNLTQFRIAAPGRVASDLRINELTVLSAGEQPAWIEDFAPTYDTADLLLVVAHPDDEYVFMGGVIPYYEAVRGKHVVVCYITESSAQRRTELLDGLWAVGEKHYPLVGKFHDKFGYRLADAYKRLGKKQTQSYMVEVFRQYRPQVVVTHDVKGEYGHAVHQLSADIVLNAMNAAGDASKYKDSAKLYGTWDVPKVYLHLWPENELIMDWTQTSNVFGGKSPLDMARIGFSCHISQQDSRYQVYTDEPYNCARFGLVRSLVGDDVAKDDFFEHLQ